MWTLDHLVDLESDFSAIHRVPSVDIDRGLARQLGIDVLPDLDGPRFFRMAARLFAYEGVLRAVLQGQMEKEAPAPRRGPQRAAESHRGGVEQVDFMQMQMQNPDMIERVRVG